MADHQADPSAAILNMGKVAAATETTTQDETGGDIETVIAQPEVEVDADVCPPANIAPSPPDTRSNFDSALGDSDISSLSTSLKSSIFQYRYENGRRYHGYKDGSYLNPDDEVEQERLDILHHLFRMMLEGKLYTAPVPANMQRVLDVGTGTGIWAIDFADEHPSANVVGTDISPMQPTWVPPNCSFYIEDAETEWLFDEQFDFIHGRALCGSIADWPKFFGQCKESLKPGGWLELQDYVSWIKADDDTLGRGEWTHEWVNEINRGTEMFGKSLNVVEKYAQWMSDAGFVDVRDEIIKVPIGPWAKDPKLKEMGKIELVQMVQAVESFTLALYTRVLGYSEDQTRVVIEGVKSEFMDRKNHWYIVYHFVSARKPED